MLLALLTFNQLLVGEFCWVGGIRSRRLPDLSIGKGGRELVNVVSNIVLS